MHLLLWLHVCGHGHGRTQRGGRGGRGPPRNSAGPTLYPMEKGPIRGDSLVCSRSRRRGSSLTHRILRWALPHDSPRPDRRRPSLGAAAARRPRPSSTQSGCPPGARPPSAALPSRRHLAPPPRPPQCRTDRRSPAAALNAERRPDLPRRHLQRGDA